VHGDRWAHRSYSGGGGARARDTTVVKLEIAVREIGDVALGRRGSMVRLCALNIALQPTFVNTLRSLAMEEVSGTGAGGVQIPTKSPADSEMMSPGDTRCQRRSSKVGWASPTAQGKTTRWPSETGPLLMERCVDP